MTYDDHESLAAALGRLASSINGFDRTIGEHIDNLRWEEAALLLRHARREVVLLQAAVGAIEARVIVGRREEGVFDDVAVPGVGVVSVARTRNRKAWDHDALAGLVIDQHLTGGDGVAPTPWEVRDWLMQAGHIDYWRVGVLKDLHIDADDYCSSEPGTPKVVIVSSDAPPAELG
jgi:hypothetical protein